MLSDIMTEGGQRMLDIARETARERILPELFEDLAICYYRESTDAVLAGAAAIATDNVMREPGKFIIK